MVDTIHFRVLGPLEVFGDQHSIYLSGTKQKATLAYLLLHANQVVSISRLLYALWPADTAPLSARKILQNSVWSLRRTALAGKSSSGTAALVTQAPGYKLTVDQDDIDLNRFQLRTAAGRRMLAEGDAEQASRILREALALWRGPVLTDLVEAGIAWPELTVAQNAHGDAMEDYFEAELACGQHQAVLGELETMVENSPTRERSAGQLMIALYRSGRQADALNVYSRVRAALVEELGLEPGQELQNLQRSVLSHDPALRRVVGGTPVTVYHDITPRLAQLTMVKSQHIPAPAAVSTVPSAPTVPPLPEQQIPAVAVDQPSVPAPNAPGPIGQRAERKAVSMLLVRARINDEGIEPDGPDADAMLHEISQRIRDNVEHFEGTVNAAIGSVSLTLFDPREDAVDAARRAVLAALSIAEDLRPDDGWIDRPQVSFHAAVVTGEALVRYPAEGGPVLITGALVDRCDALLARTAAGEIRVCETTHEAAEPLAVFSADDHADDWRLQGIRLDVVQTAAGRDFELGLVLGLLERTRHRSTTHMVTLLGEPGSGKSKLLDEFSQLAQQQCTHVARFRVPPRPANPIGMDMNAIHALQRELVKTICAVRPTDTPVEAVARLGRTVRQLITDAEHAERLFECVAPYLDPDLEFLINDPKRELDAWADFLARTDFNDPFVLVVDDLHMADDAMLDFVGGLAEFAKGPLLVVASARSELLHRRPMWGGGNQQFTMLTLESLPDTEIHPLLLDTLLAPRQPRSGAATAEGANGTDRPRPVGSTGWRKYLRSLLDSAPRPVVVRPAARPAIARLGLCGSS